MGVDMEGTYEEVFERLIKAGNNKRSAKRIIKIWNEEFPDMVLTPKDKTYIVTYHGMFGKSTEKVTGPNKTLVRMMFIGEHQKFCKIISIDEVKEEKK